MPKQVYILLALFSLTGFFFIFTTQGNKKREENAFLSYIPEEYRSKVYLFSGNPFSAEKALIGRFLFYDRRLSVNQTRSCASCHDPKFSFTDGYRRSVGALGDLHQRNSAPLINLVFNQHLTAADPSLNYPEQQLDNPLFHTNPIELGWKGNEKEILGRLRRDRFYNAEMKAAFPGDEDPVTVKNVQYSLASFVKTLISLNSPYDKYKKAGIKLSDEQKRGMELFFSSKLNCAQCHGGVNFANASLEDSAGNPQHYFNTGLYEQYPTTDQGLYEKTFLKNDIGKFKVPTLRNLAFTAPYFHDGSAQTLDDVIAAYESGGKKHPNKHPLIKGFQLSTTERKALISFLFSLTDSSICNNQSFSNPFEKDETKY